MCGVIFLFSYDGICMARKGTTPSTYHTDDAVYVMPPGKVGKSITKRHTFARPQPPKPLQRMLQREVRRQCVAMNDPDGRRIVLDCDH